MFVLFTELGNDVKERLDKFTIPYHHGFYLHYMGTFIRISDTTKV